MARLVLTLPEPRASAWVDALRKRGHEARPLAFVTLCSLAGTAQAAALMVGLERFERVVFVSPSAIEAFAEALSGSWPAGVAPAVVGPGSLAALAAHGADRHPELLVPGGPAFDADALLALPELAAPLQGRVLVVRAEGGNPLIERTLAARGAKVEVFEAYRRHSLTPTRQDLHRLAHWLAQPRAPAARILVTTVEAAERLAGVVEEVPSLGILRELDALAIHPRIAARLRALGWKSITPVDPGFEALLAEIESKGEAATNPATRKHRDGSDSD